MDSYFVFYLYYILVLLRFSLCFWACFEVDRLYTKKSYAAVIGNNLMISVLLIHPQNHEYVCFLRVDLFN